MFRKHPSAASCRKDDIFHEVEPDDAGALIVVKVTADGVLDHVLQFLEGVRLRENGVPEGRSLEDALGAFCDGEDDLAVGYFAAPRRVYPPPTTGDTSSAVRESGVGPWCYVSPMAKKKKKRRPAPKAGTAWRRMLRSCSEKTVSWLDSLALTRVQRDRIAHAVNLAQLVSLRQGVVIGTEEALERIAQTWLDAHRERTGPSG